jgi:hypothetical protein
VTIFRQVINDVIVDRIIVPDGADPSEISEDWPNPETYQLETEDPPPQIGWSWDGAAFVPPPMEQVLPAPPAEPTIEERLAKLEAKLAKLGKSAKL